MRSKVYDKARAAIQRQIQAANPPLPEDVADARRTSLEDAIERTERYYLAQEGAEEAPDGFAPPPQGPAQASPAAPARGPMPDMADQRLRPPPPRSDEGPAGPAMPKATVPGADGRLRPPPGGSMRRDPQPFLPPSAEEPDEVQRPAALGAPFILPAAEARGDPRREASLDAGAGNGAGTPVSHLDDSAIPAPDLSAPRYAGGRPRSKTERRLAPLAAGIAAVAVLAGLGALGWTYRADIEAMLVDPSTVEPSDVATTAPGSTQADGTAAPQAGTAPTTAAEAARESTRRYTQRLLPDGSETEMGPGESASNAFNEGTDVAPASPVDGAPAEPGQSPTVSAEIGQAPAAVGTQGGPAATPPGDLASGESAEGTDTAAVDPAEPSVAVGQKAVFYQERTPNAPGTQETGSVVWSVVNEPPMEGQASEPAIRAVAEVPDENIKLVMTIRRNVDPTLPASHVIELEFQTPPGFTGGGVANVQRLALKPSEQARGEPLIGVAGKISDGFFIIALNNLDQATQNNLALLEREQWIDIPLAYATGRRALMSIEKGIPGDRAFKEAIAAWSSKT
ncbi:hypothetical protein ASG48_01555 [Aurantimonas sp. Leaf443]|nr:hypothetical protein ASG48_01555 [Aurantimonas sp. Leaf443]